MESIERLYYANLNDSTLNEYIRQLSTDDSIGNKMYLYNDSMAIGKDDTGYYLKFDIYKGFLFLLATKDGCNKWMPIYNADNTTDWLLFSNNYLLLIKQHTINKFSKRLFKKYIPERTYNTRARFSLDRGLQAINVLMSITNNPYLIYGGSINEKYNDQFFLYQENGLFPVTRISEHCFEVTTFISVEMLNEKQIFIYEQIRKNVER